MVNKMLFTIKEKRTKNTAESIQYLSSPCTLKHVKYDARQD